MFGLGCLGSLWTPRPLMFGFAREFAGSDTATGQEMTRLWQYEGYRHVFRVITAVWGIALLIEAGLRVIVIYTASTTTALLFSKIMTYVSIAILCAWTVGYGTQQKKKGERMAAGTPPSAQANVPDAQPK